MRSFTLFIHSFFRSFRSVPFDDENEMVIKYENNFFVLTRRVEIVGNEIVWKYLLKKNST